MPRVTIGMPVFNCAAHVSAAIDSLLAQSYGDFELIVGDNASTDGTSEILAGYARQDRRVKHIRHPANIGANLNYSFVAEAGRGIFMKWASGSDWCAPEFLERCIDALEHDPEAVLAAPRTRLFANDRSKAEDYSHDIEILESRPLQRLDRVRSDLALNNSINGVIRMVALRQTRLIERYYQADIVLMGHLAMLGKFLLVDEPLFYRRMEVSTATSLQGADARRRHHYPQMSASALCQAWRRHAGWVQAVAAAPMTVPERVRAFHYVLRRAAWDRGALVSDIREALRHVTWLRAPSPEA